MTSSRLPTICELGLPSSNIRGACRLPLGGKDDVTNGTYIISLIKQVAANSQQETNCFILAYHIGINSFYLIPPLVVKSDSIGEKE